MCVTAEVNRHHIDSDANDGTIVKMYTESDHSTAQIDEFLETGKFAVLEEGEGGEGAAPQSKAVDEAAPFLTL